MCPETMDTQCPQTVDKSVATEPDFTGEGEWKMVQLESLLATLVDSKVVAMKADARPGYMKRYSAQQALHAQQQMLKSVQHHHHRKHRHCRHAERAKAKSAVCKVRQWDDGSAMVVCDASQVDDDRFVAVDMEDLEGGCEDTGRRKKRKKRRHVAPTQTPPKVRPKEVDPNELPKRARWTIIITAGFLLLTCMLLVGITLRMAPLIDEMVHNQNEELMNSLNRGLDDNDTISAPLP